MFSKEKKRREKNGFLIGFQFGNSKVMSSIVLPCKQINKQKSKEEENTTKRYIATTYAPHRIVVCLFFICLYLNFGLHLSFEIYGGFGDM